MGRRSQLPIACMLILASQFGSAQAGLSFQEVSEAAGVSLMHDPDGAAPLGEVVPNWYGPGVAWADLNGDNWLDLFVANGQTGSKLFLNNADGTFSDGTAALGILAGVVANGVSMADTDNNGILEIAVGNFFNEPHFYKGSTSRLVNTASAAGLIPMFPQSSLPETMGTSFGDFNSDGWVDVYFANYRVQPDMLFEGIGGGAFTRTDKVAATLSGWGFMGVFFDFDNDGDQDIYVANDFGMNFLFENGGAESGWTLSDKAFPYNATDDMLMPLDPNNDKSMSMGLAIADYDNDLDLDIYVTNYFLNAFYRNDGLNARGFWKFTEISNFSGAQYPLNCWGVDFVDLDLDGDLDLVQTSGYIFSGPAPQPENLPDKLWLNSGAPDYKFSDVSDIVGFNYEGMGRGLATGDYDRDGDLDIVITNNTFDHPETAARTEGWLKLFRNDQDGQSHWINLKLRGSGEHVAGLGCNRSAVGARVYLTSGGTTQMREVQAGSSYLSQNSLELEFGLGAVSVIDELKVRWLCGSEEIFSGIGADDFFVLREGTEVATVVPVAITSFDAIPMRGGIQLEWRTALGDRITQSRILRASAATPDRLQPLSIDIRSENGRGSAFDTTAEVGREYAYQLHLTGNDGVTITSTTLFATMGEGAPLASRAQVGQNFPNPFNPSTTILFSLPRSGTIKLLIHDERGRLIRTLYSGQMDLGEHQIDWDGADDTGLGVASGVYHYSIVSEQGSSSRRMTLVR